MVEMETVRAAGRSQPLGGSSVSEKVCCWSLGSSSRRIEQKDPLFVNKHVLSAFCMQGPGEVQEGEGRQKDAGLWGWACSAVFSSLPWIRTLLAVHPWVTGHEFSVSLSSVK